MKDGSRADDPSGGRPPPRREVNRIDTDAFRQHVRLMLLAQAWPEDEASSGDPHEDDIEGLPVLPPPNRAWDEVRRDILQGPDAERFADDVPLLAALLQLEIAHMEALALGPDGGVLRPAGGSVGSSRASTELSPGRWGALRPYPLPRAVEAASDALHALSWTTPHEWSLLEALRDRIRTVVVRDVRWNAAATEGEAVHFDPLEDIPVGDGTLRVEFLTLVRGGHVVDWQWVHEPSGRPGWFLVITSEDEQVVHLRLPLDGPWGSSKEVHLPQPIKLLIEQDQGGVE